MLFSNQYHTSLKILYLINVSLSINAMIWTNCIQHMNNPVKRVCTVQGAVTLLVLTFDDAINWIPKPYIRKNILVHLAHDASTTLPVKFIRRGILTSRMWYICSIKQLSS